MPCCATVHVPPSQWITLAPPGIAAGEAAGPAADGSPATLATHTSVGETACTTSYSPDAGTAIGLHRWPFQCSTNPVGVCPTKSWVPPSAPQTPTRSEERRVGKECR